MIAAAKAPKRVRRPKTGQRESPAPDPHRVEQRPVGSLTPAPENERLYRPVRADDVEVRDLARDIAENGVREPIVASLDGYIVSGHSRHCAATSAGLAAVPVRVLPVRRSDGVDAFTTLLRSYNRQRDKSLDEKLREELADADPEEAYRALVAHRRERSRVEGRTLELGAVRGRKAISAGKRPMLDAVLRVVGEHEDYWPLSDRRIHYMLLNDPPFRFVSAAGEGRNRYRNDRRSYGDLCDLLTRARLAGDVPMEAVADETRPVTEWNVHPGPRAFLRRETGRMFKGYRRDLMRSQPCHVEILGEKNTVRPLLEDVAGRYSIPVTTGRGYCSLPPRAAMAGRFEAGGKDRLVLLIVSDFDPEGEDIASSFARSMRDDFGIDPHAVKVALTAEQARRFDLPGDATAKLSSGKAKKFTAAHGPHVWELEALPPETLQSLLRDAIDAVIDVDAFNEELEAEKQDAAWLTGLRRTVHEELKFALEAG